MKKLIYLLMLAAVLGGCGSFKKVFKSRERSERKIETKSTIDTENITVKTGTKVVKETEQADTSKYTSEKNITTTTKATLSDLVEGLTVIDSGLVKVVQKYDTLSKTLKTDITIKPERVDFTINRTRETVSNTTETTNNKTSEKSDVVVKEDTSKSTKNKEPEKVWILAVIVIVVAIIVVLAGVYLFKRRGRLI